MIRLEAKTDCCGCTACYAACPVSAISMEPDEEGFLYPQVNTDSCIGCGRCERVCPVLGTRASGAESKGEIVSAYAARTRDNDVLANSSSGGFTTPLIDWVISNGGVVCGAAFDDRYRVCHRLFENEDAAKSTRGSKYVQSEMGECFAQIKEQLRTGRQVCFIGTPCQVAGLKLFLQEEFLNLITIDVICYGVPSPWLWSKYLDYQMSSHHSAIKSVTFRNKTYGYHSSTMRIEFENGETYFGSARVDYMLKSFFKDVASRPICYECPFKALHHVSDITIFDCWHVSRLVEGLDDDDRGYTNVIIQSNIGRDALAEVEGLFELHPVDVARMIELDGDMALGCAKPHPLRPIFYEGLDSETIEEHVQRLLPVTKVDRLMERSKGLFHRLGLMHLLSDIRRWLKHRRKV